MPNLDQLLPMRRTTEFTFPQRDELIPRVFGNFLDPSVIPADDRNGGMTKAVFIDRVNLVAAVNAGPAVMTPPQVYINNIGPQEASSYVWTPVHSYEGRPPVATLQFRLGSVLNTEVSVRFSGSVDGQGLPLTNPIQSLVWLLSTHGTWRMSDFDQGTVEQTRRDMDNLGYPFFWVFNEERTVREWLLEIMPHYHTDFIETGQGRLAVILDRSVTTLPVTPDYHIRADEIDDFGSPLLAMRSVKEFDDLANQVILHGRYNWAGGQPTSTFTADFVQSQAAYRAAYPIEFTFRGMYTPTHATTWLNSFVSRHGFEPTVRQFTLRGLRGTPLIPPRLITVEWPPLGWSQRLMKVRRRTTSWRNRRVMLECIDCQCELGETADVGDLTLAERRSEIARVYQWIPGTIGDRGIIEDAPGLTKNEAANGDFELGNNGQWNLNSGTGVDRWTIENSPANAYQGRFYALSVPGLADYTIRTMRRRIDPSEWVTVSGWFRNHAGGANGSAQTIVEFYGVDGQGLGFATGNLVLPTTTYTESILLAEAPVGSYHYVPGCQLSPTPTDGQWRGDRIWARSGSRAELMTLRMNELSGGNAILNGSFDSGPVPWDWQNPAASGWYLDGASPLSGSWHATHVGNGPPGQGHRLYNLTRILLTPGQQVQLQGWWKTIGSGVNGQIRFGIQFFSPAGAFITEAATGTMTGPRSTYTWWGQPLVVPTGVQYGQMWAEVGDHTTPLTWWLLDDCLVWFP
jgi:hypothetical protein